MQHKVISRKKTPKSSMNDKEEDNLCQSVFEAITNAQERFKVMEGRDRLSLQMEILEWLSGDWKEMQVEWMEEQEQT